MTSRRLKSSAGRRGSVLVMTLWVLIVVVALVLSFAHTVRVDVAASGNRQSMTRAAAVEAGAEQYVLSLAEAALGDASLVTDVPMEQLRVGDGYFWILRPDPEDEASYVFGIGDEAGKLNLNDAETAQLLKMPGMTQEVADAVHDWRDSDSEVTGQGAENDYYAQLPVPYTCKNGLLETVDELLLVKNFTESLLSGYDVNRDGIVDANEQALGGGGLATGFSSQGSTGRGLLPFVTVYTVDPNLTSTGQPRALFKETTTPPTGGATGGTGGATGGTGGAAGGAGGSTGGTGGATGGTAGGATTVPLDDVLKEVLSPQRAAEVSQRAKGNASPKNIFEFAQATGLTPQEIPLLADRLTSSAQKTFSGLINVSTAPREVLLTLPGLEADDVEKLLGARAGADLTNVAWVGTTLSQEKAIGIGSRITARSYQYSADILAISADGRSFRRVRVVVDARSAPARIVYRRDLTSLGWPLAPEIREALRRGEVLPAISAAPGRITSGARTAVARAN